MGFGEEVGDLARRFDPPVRDAHAPHLRLRVPGEYAVFLDLAFSNGLHGLECERRLHPLLDQVDHDVVAAADGLVDVGRPAHDQIVNIARPHVRPV